MAECAVTYEGRLTTHLRPATRLILIKDNGSIQVHADHYPPTGFKPLNWMTGGKKTTLRVTETSIEAVRGTERLFIRIIKEISRTNILLGVEPGLRSYGTEREMQIHLAAHPQLLGEGMELIQREYPTDVGPADLLCRDGNGYVIVEIKRAVGHISGVDQLLRYVESLTHTSALYPLRGLYVAQGFKPQTLQYAERKGIECLPIYVEELRRNVMPEDYSPPMTQ